MSVSRQPTTHCTIVIVVSVFRPSPNSPMHVQTRITERTLCVTLPGGKETIFWVSLWELFGVLIAPGVVPLFLETWHPSQEVRTGPRFPARSRDYTG